MSRLAHHLYWRLDSGLVLRLLVFAAIFSLAAVPPLDPDLWWHLANGRLLVQLGSWPHTDLYSFSAAGHPWVMHEWLSDLLMYALVRTGGLPLLVAVFAALVTAGALCLFLLLRWTGLHPTAAVVVTFVGALAGSTAWGARPQLVNLLFLGLLACGLVRYRAGRLRAWWLVPFLWLWANLHSGFLAGVILSGAFLLGEGLEEWRDSGALGRRWAHLALALVAAVALAVVNPYGLETVLFPLGTLTSPLIQNNIQEWASPDFHSTAGHLLEVLLFVILAGLATGRVKARAAEWLWAMSFLYLALASQRHVPLFVLAAAPLIARCAQAGLESVGRIPGSLRVALPSRRAAFVAAPTPAAAAARLRLLPAVNALLLVVVATGMFAYRALPNLRPQDEAHALAAAFPVQSTTALQALGRPLRIFNDYGFGGYLVYQLQPTGSRVFIDGRVEVYGPRIFEDYLAVTYASPRWRSVIAGYEPDAIMLPANHPLVTSLQSDRAWRFVAGDRVATVFVANVLGDG